MDMQELEGQLKPFGNTFIEKFEELAETRKDKVFFYYGEEDRGYTFGEFNQLANSVAHNLRSLGLEKGNRVSLMLFNPVVTTISMFAIWKLGAVYCPINYNFKGKLLSYQINDTNPSLLITEQNFVSEINHVKSEIPALLTILHQPRKSDHDFDAAAATVKLDGGLRQAIFGELLEGTTSNPGVPLQDSDIANIIYTSGTTGNPKGVLQPHRYLHNYLFPGLNLAHPDDVIYNDLPLYHVAGAFYNVVRAAWSGCQVAVWDRFSPTDFWNRIKKCKGTFAILLDVMVPWLMMQEATPEDRNNTLKMVHMQPLAENHHEMAERFGIDFITIGYGSTEAGGVFGGCIDEMGDEEGTPPELRSGHTKDEMRALIKKINMPLVPGQEDVMKGFMGKPALLQEIAILGDNGQPVSSGSPGQLVIRPKLPSLILKEYFNKPDATSEALKDEWYYSGDIIVQEGDIFCFVDRIGGFIRARGENMSSHQVEGLINGHPAINNSAAFPVDAIEGSEEDIAAFIVLNQDAELSETELRTWMASEMPRYMIPKHVRFVNELPVTPTFKVEKYKLKARIMTELGLNILS
ncbi:MAG: AMP-binding protein [Deltaproteobacteria bacterium]|jgi:carnitine-CoA ligase|nr:AMP-binding protein [Deltaproteobacteria bacterium]MBT4267573.1 AMP-binding protein [Deltaproteobacteria bacterium]MBT4642354.1 AMP-binding protein [Deltaproteobacteria bacterium]MBT6502457.1 AMP-binding protein [Deltaproteobacteria bacterium]MBT7152293.1 AMP-binding protein [Deltaproteobacteria bacterium]